MMSTLKVYSFMTDMVSTDSDTVAIK